MVIERIEFHGSPESKMANATEQCRSYGWIELAARLAGGQMVRDHYARYEDLDHILAWKKRFNNTDVFSSVAFYAEPRNSGPFIVPVYFDIDGPDDLSAARTSALSLCEMLMDRMQVPQDSLDIFFSGHKGFHVMVPAPVFGAFYSPNVLGLYRRMAQKAGAAGVPFIDQSVYTVKRLWRLSNSKNSKSGLFKIPLTYEGLRDTDIEGIRILARNPRPEDTVAMQQVCQAAVEWYKRAIAVFTELQRSCGRTVTGTKFTQGWRTPPCIKAIQQSVLPDGVRHQTYLSLARFFRWIRMHPDEIRERIEDVDNRNPIRDPAYIERTVKWACEHPGFPGCSDDSLHRHCHQGSCFYATLKNAKTENNQSAGKRLPEHQKG